MRFLLCRATIQRCSLLSASPSAIITSTSQYLSITIQAVHSSSFISSGLSAKRRKQLFPDLFVLCPHPGGSDARVNRLERGSQGMQKRLKDSVIELRRNLKAAPHVTIERALTVSREVVNVNAVTVYLEIIPADAGQPLAREKDRKCIGSQAQMLISAGLFER